MKSISDGSVSETVDAPLKPRPDDWMAAHPDLVQKFTSNQRLFLEFFSEKASISLACADAGISRTAFYKWMHDSENFRLAFTSARQAAIHSLEDEVIRRGMHGVQDPVFFKDEIVGFRTRYSDTLLMFYLNGNAPEKYRNRSSLEHTGPGGGPVLTVSLLDELVRD